MILHLVSGVTGRAWKSGFEIRAPMGGWTEVGQVRRGGPRQVTLFAFPVLRADCAASSTAVAFGLLALTGSTTDDRLSIAVARLCKPLASLCAPGEPARRALGRSYRLRVGSDRLEAELVVEQMRHGRVASKAGDSALLARVLTDAQAPGLGRVRADVVPELLAKDGGRRPEVMRHLAVETHIDVELRFGREDQLIGELKQQLVVNPNWERLASQRCRNSIARVSGASPPLEAMPSGAGQLTARSGWCAHLGDQHLSRMLA